MISLQNTFFHMALKKKKKREIIKVENKKPKKGRGGGGGGSGTNNPAQELIRRDKKTVPRPAPPGYRTQGLWIRIPKLWPLSYVPPVCTAMITSHPHPSSAREEAQQVQSSQIFTVFLIKQK